MNLSLYAPTREDNFDSFDAAIDASQNIYTYTSVPLHHRDIRVEEEGKVFVGTDVHPLTMGGMEGLCRRFRIPNPFAERIPFDLLRTNIARLSGETPANEAVAYVRADGTIVNFSNTLTVPPSNVEIIQRTAKLFNTSDQTNRINLSDRGIDLDIIHQRSKVVEARVGDPIKVGLRISASQTAHWTGYAKLLLYILRCTNGAVMPKSFGMEKLRIRPEQNAETLYNRFFRKVGAMEPNMIILSKIVSSSDTIYLLDAEFATVWKALKNRDLGVEVADELMGATKELREEILARVRLREKSNVLLSQENQEPDKPTPTKVYTAFDQITSYALTCNQEVRQSLQDLAGELIANTRNRLN